MGCPRCVPCRHPLPLPFPPLPQVLSELQDQYSICKQNYEVEIMRLQNTVADLEKRMQAKQEPPAPALQEPPVASAQEPAAAAPQEAPASAPQEPPAAGPTPAPAPPPAASNGRCASPPTKRARVDRTTGPPDRAVAGAPSPPRPQSEPPAPAVANGVRAWSVTCRGSPAEGVAPECLHSLGLGAGGLGVLGFSPCGTYVALGGLTAWSVTVWNTRSAKAAPTLLSPPGAAEAAAGGPPQCACFCPSGQLLIGAAPDGALTAWDVAQGRTVGAFAGTAAPPIALRHFPKSACVASVGRDGRAAVWSVADKKLLRVLDADGGGGEGPGATALAISPNEDRLALGLASGALELWALPGWERARVVPGAAGAGAVQHMAFAPDGARLATAAADRVVRVWDAAADATPRALPARAAAVVALGYSPDGQWLVVACADYAITVWGADAGEPQWGLRGPADTLPGFALSPAAAAFASPGSDGGVALWSYAALVAPPKDRPAAAAKAKAKRPRSAAEKPPPEPAPDPTAAPPQSAKGD